MCPKLDTYPMFSLECHIAFHLTFTKYAVAPTPDPQKALKFALSFFFLLSVYHDFVRS